LPHRGRASDSETDRVARLTAPHGGSDEDQNGFLEAETLDAHRVIGRMREAGRERGRGRGGNGHGIGQGGLGTGGLGPGDG